VNQPPLARYSAQLIGYGEIIEERETATDRLEELILVVERQSPLHVVVIVDAAQQEERIVTAYDPDPDRWSNDYRKRRR
jgi:hypothetical protein